jgi:hypothetical protein
MIKQPHSAFGLPTKLLKVISSEPPRHAEGHDKWLLDEALAETFPASDSIAVSPSHLLRASPPRRSREVEGSSKIFDCKIGSDNDPKPTALETPFDCEHCHTRIPATVAISFGGADYIYHFCGPQCLEAWCMAAIARDK